MDLYEEETKAKLHSEAIEATKACIELVQHEFTDEQIHALMQEMKFIAESRFGCTSTGGMLLCAATLLGAAAKGFITTVKEKT